MEAEPGTPTAKTTRRSILMAGGLLGVSLALPDWDLWAAAMQHAPAVAPEAGPSVLERAEFVDLEAIAAQIVPSDVSGPGAQEAGAAQFIDRALSSFYARLAPEFRAGLQEFQRGVRARYPEPGTFAQLPSSDQIEWLRSVEHTPFFVAVRQLTVMGMFSSPAYGGNRNGIGWQILGFVDQHAFTPPFGHYDRDYPGFQGKT